MNFLRGVNLIKTFTLVIFTSTSVFTSADKNYLNKNSYKSGVTSVNYNYKCSTTHAKEGKNQIFYSNLNKSPTYILQKSNL